MLESDESSDENSSDDVSVTPESEPGDTVLTFKAKPSVKVEGCHYYVKYVKIVPSADESESSTHITVNSFKIPGDGYITLKSNDLMREYGSDPFLVLDVEFCPEKTLKPMLADGVLVRMENSVKIKIYKFFGHSPNQLRNRTCVLYDTEKLDFNGVIRKFGNFNAIHNVAKRANRIGLLLATAQPILDLTQDEFEVTRDIEFNSYNFTDGCGFISYETAKDIAKYLEIDFRYLEQKWKVPSVFEIQFRGYKGLLALNPKLGENQDSKIRIQVRQSLKKFFWTKRGPSPLCVVGGSTGVSRPYSHCALDMGLVRHLSALGVPQSVFLSKQKACFDELKKLMSNWWLLIKYLSLDPQYYNLVDRLLATSQIDDETSTALKKIRSEAGRRMAGIGEPLTIPIERSRKVYGVCDPTGYLQPGCCFFQPTISGRPRSLNGTKVFVAKIPCHNPGDIRVLTCVNSSGCDHLVDCVVFPVQGERPHTDEIAGSNLNGDKYVICWDQELVPFQHDKATTYSVSPTKIQRNISQNDLRTHFIRYGDVMSKLEGLYENWSCANGVRSRECLLIASLMKAVADTSENGKYVGIPHFLYKIPKTKTVDLSDKLVVNEIRMALKDDCLTCTKEDLMMLLEMPNSLFDEELLVLCFNWCSRNKQVDMINTIIKLYKTQLDKRTENDVDVCGIQLEPKSLNSSSILNKTEINFVKDNFSGNWVRFYHKYGIEMFPFQLFDNILSTGMRKLVLFKISLPGSLECTVGFSGSFYGSNEIDWSTKLFLSFPDSETSIISPKCGSIISRDKKHLYFYDEKKVSIMRILPLEDDATAILLLLFPSLDGTVFTVESVEIYMSAKDAHCTPFDTMKGSFIQSLQETFDENDNNNETVTLSNNYDRNFPCLERKVRVTDTHFVDVLKFYENPNVKTATTVLKSILRECQTKGNTVTSIETRLSTIISRLSNSEDCLLILRVILELLTDPELPKWLLNKMRQLGVEVSLNSYLELLDDFVYKFPCNVRNKQDSHKLYKILNVIKTGLLQLKAPHFDDQPETASYFHRWANLITMEMTHESVQATEAATCRLQLHDVSFCDVFYDDDLEKRKIIIVNVHSPCRNIANTDGVAVSPASQDYAFAPILFGEVVDATGNVIMLRITYMKQGRENRLSQTVDTDSEEIWKRKLRFDFFPNAVTYTRMRYALQIACRLKHVENPSPIVRAITSCASPYDIDEPRLGPWQPSTSNFYELNPVQQDAVRRTNTQSITLIRGPPGTGKTRTASVIVQEWLNLDPDEKILVCAQTNEAVNNLAVKMIEIGIQKADMIRIGVREKIDHKLLKITCDAATNLEHKKIFCTTCISSNLAPLREFAFTRVLIDEAAQCTEPCTLVPLILGASKLCLIGDDKQLPPLVKIRYAEGLKISMFEKLSKHKGIITLNIQYRMHPGLAIFPSDTFYDGLLKSGVEPSDRQPIKGFNWPSSVVPAAFVNLKSRERSGYGKSTYNQLEARTILEILRNILRNGLRKRDVGVVTPYTAQVKEIKSVLKRNRIDVDVRTVDGFQGQERELIIFSCVRANAYNGSRGKVGFLDDANRMNVLLTRAKRGMIIVGHRETLRFCDLWKKWLQWADRRRLIMNYNEPRKDHKDMQGKKPVRFIMPTRGKLQNKWR